MAYTIVDDTVQTDFLVRQVRNWVGDTASDLYENDSTLAQALFDVFEVPFLARTGISTELTNPASTSDPLATDDELTTRQKIIWALFAALHLLRPETLSMARVSGTIRSAAGSITLTEIHKNMSQQYAVVEGELAALLFEESGSGMIAFVDLTGIERTTA